MEREIILNGCAIAYELERKTVKNLNLRIKPDGSIHVSAPRRMPEGMINSFLASKADFILEAVEMAKKRQKEVTPGTILVLGREIPDDFENDAKREKWLREQCIEAVSHSFAELYPIFEKRGIPLPEIKFRRMKSRWGSCQPKNGILTFNSALIHVPEKCIEYVVLHELCHFIHPDHSPRFKSELSSIMPDWKSRQREIREYESLLIE